MRAPRFITEVWSGMRQYPKASLGLVTVVGLLTTWQLLPGPDATPQPAAAVGTYHGAVPSHASLEGAIGSMQSRMHEMDLVITQQRTTIEQLQTALETREQQNAELLRKQQEAQQLQNARIEAALQQAQALAAAQPAPAVIQAALPAAAPQETPAPKLRVLEPDPTPDPVIAADAPEIFLPAGSVAKGRLINGVFATSVQGGGIPAEFTVDTDFKSAQGTTVPLTGCRAVGKTQPVFTAARLEVELTRIACVLPDGRTFEQPLRGYVTGFDNVLGIPGHVDYRDPQILRELLLAAAAAAPASAFREVEQTQSASALGVTVTTTTDVGQEVAARIANLYLERAEAYLPVVWVRPNQDVYLYVLEGIAITGLTASAGNPIIRQAVFD